MNEIKNNAFEKAIENFSLYHEDSLVKNVKIQKDLRCGLHVHPLEVVMSKSVSINKKGKL